MCRVTCQNSHRFRKLFLDKMDGDEYEIDHDNDILYDLIVFKEWVQEIQQIPLRSPTDPPDATSTSLTNNGGTPFNVKRILFSLWQRGRNLYGNSETVSTILQSRLPWKFALSKDAANLIVLQDNHFEILNSRDNYQATVVRVRIPYDPLGHCRSVCWSEDCSLFAITYSNGSIEVYDVVIKTPSRL